MARTNVVIIPLVVEVKDNQPTLQSVSAAGVVGSMTLRWTLETKNSSNTDIATFNSQDGMKGIAFQGPLPDGVTIRSSTGNEDGTAWRVDIDSTLASGSANQELHYTVYYLFQGKPYSDDPVIVVTPEPVGSGSDVRFEREPARTLRLARAV